MSKDINCMDLLLDRFDRKIIDTLKENGELNLIELRIKSGNREGMPGYIKRLKSLEELKIISLHKCGVIMREYKIKLRKRK